jgi:hypothetical protein
MIIELYINNIHVHIKDNVHNRYYNMNYLTSSYIFGIVSSISVVIMIDEGKFRN